MPRRRGPLTERDLTEEVLYLHSLWRRGPPAPARVPVPAAAAPTPSRPARRAPRKRKRRRLEGGAAEPQDTGSESPLAPSPPASPKALPDAPASSSPEKAPPLPPPSPGSLAQQDALRAAKEFFSRGGSGDEGPEPEGEEDEEEAVGFFTGMFERDAALRGHYERRREEGQFKCMACAARKVRKVKGRAAKVRRYQGCFGLLQHARFATRYGRRRPGAHRALAAVICRVLGWDFEGLPNIVIDPRGRLGQALAAEATADAQEAKENDDTGENNGSEDDEEDVESGMEDSSTDYDEEANELEEDVEEIGPLNCEDDSKNEVLEYETAREVNASKDDSLKPDNNGEVHEQDVNKEFADKENTYLQSPKDTCQNEETCKDAAIQEDVDATESEKELGKIADDTGESAVTRLGNNSSMDVDATESEKELGKIADDTGESAVTRLGNNSSMKMLVQMNRGRLIQQVEFVEGLEVEDALYWRERKEQFLSSW
ncbi:hypothetical protein ACP4OV_030519 [Aristida adscensionis]